MFLIEKRKEMDELERQKPVARDPIERERQPNLLPSGKSYTPKLRELRT